MCNPVKEMFKVFYNEEVNFQTNQGGDYRSNYLRQGDNQGWNNYEGWRDRHRE